jgi:hypothetical protein
VRMDTSKLGEINVFDGTVVSGAIELKFEDLIGQPTWIDAQRIQIKTVMRADISAGTPGGNLMVTLPKGILMASTRGAVLGFYSGGTGTLIQSGDVLTFQGAFPVESVRHVGKFRQPTGESWVTIITALVPNASSNGIANQSGQQSFSSPESAAVANPIQSSPTVNQSGQQSFYGR